MAAVALLAFLPATAAANGPLNPIPVNDHSTDAQLTAAGESQDECISKDVGGGCTLRAAVELASFESRENDHEVVTIDVPAGTYTNTAGNGGELVIENHANVVIIGAGAGETIIDGGEVDAVIEVEEEASLILQGVTIQHGHQGGGGGIFGDEDASITIKESTIANNSAITNGGGIYGESGDSITIERSTIANNTAEGDDGGGIYSENNVCDGAGAGNLTIKQSTIANNTAGEDDDGDGGGIYTERRPRCIEARPAHSSTRNVEPAATGLSSDAAALTIEESTIAGNTAGSDGGGEGGGIYEEVENEDPIVNSTIANNVAGDDGGGIYAGDEDVGVLISDTVSDNTTESGDTGNNLAGGEIGRIELRNTIVAEEPGEHERNCEGDVGSLVSGAGYNLDYPSEPGETPPADACGLSEEDHDLVGVAPALDPKGLQSNGGPTQTIALLGTSPAIGVVPVAGDCDESLDGPDLVDQRGVTRPGIAGDGCDIGAYEYTVSAPVVTPPTPPPAAGVLSIKITAPVQCTSKRDITIHIQNVKQLGLVSAVVSIDGKAKRTLKGRSLTTAIDLKGLPEGTFTVEIVAHRRNGQKVSGKRTYHTCRATPLPGHSYLPL